MAGTKAGGLKAAQTNKAKHGEHFYALIGSIGGKKTGMKGFALDTERARNAGSKAGKISKIGHKYLYTRNGYNYYTLKSTGKTVKYVALEGNK